MSAIACYGQGHLLIDSLKEKVLPKEIAYNGKFHLAVQWEDSLGSNIVVLSATGVFEKNTKTENYRGLDAQIFAYHYVKTDNHFRKMWRIYDFISDCPVDLGAEFIPNSFQVTDLDNDGIAEIWVVYKKVCHGDVSPWDLKIIMYEGKEKYAIRGQTKVFVGTNENGKNQYGGGEYTYDPSFANGPDVFLTFARKKWNKIIEQK